MILKVLFWNIWLENQLKGIERSDKLLEELTVIVKKYSPDCIGLNEVLKHNEHEIPLINSLLESLGYVYHYFSHSSPFTTKWDIGSAICSKIPLKYIEEIELGRNATAEKKGHSNYPIKAIAAKLDMSDDIDIGIIVAHPINLKPSTIRDHFIHTKNLSNFVKNSSYKNNTIIGGDFNEPMYFPRSFKRRTDSHLHHVTGTKKNPTWRHNTWRRTPLRANLDKLFWTKNGALELIEFKVIESHVSDHRPLYAEFRILNQNR
jgi:endonuclease/exonuclease/phosphatase family metal-dependent hydrolase